MSTTYLQYLDHEIENNELPFIQDLVKLIGENVLKSNIHFVRNNICIIRLSNCNLTLIPESIKLLQFLERLDFSQNPITVIPVVIGELNKLTYLNLDRTDITYLPDSIGNLTELTELSLASTLLEFLPGSIGKLQKLTELILGEVGFGSRPGKLTNLLESFGNLKSLKKLVLDNLPLRSLPLSFGNLTNLHDLKMYNCGLTILPESLGKLSKLKKLEIRNTPISKLPESLGNLQQLETLDVWRSEINTIPKTIGKCQNLKYVDLRGNKIKELPDSMGNLKLESLVLTENQFTHLPYVLWPISTLKTLNLEKNPIDKNEMDFINRGLDFLRDYFKQRAAMAIFISHAVIDYEPYDLAKFGAYLATKPEVYKVFLCEQDLSGNIDDFMDKNVPISDIVFFLGTQKSVFKSPDCAHELELSAKYQVPIYPMKGDDVTWKDMASKGFTPEHGIPFSQHGSEEEWEKIYQYVKKFHASHSGLYKIKTAELIVESPPQEKWKKEISELALKSYSWENFSAIWYYLIESDMFQKFYSKKAAELEYYLTEMDMGKTTKIEYFTKVFVSLYSWISTEYAN